jgi:hypothetical protein
LYLSQESRLECSCQILSPSNIAIFLVKMIAVLKAGITVLQKVH